MPYAVLHIRHREEPSKAIPLRGGTDDVSMVDQGLHAPGIGVSNPIKGDRR